MIVVGSRSDHHVGIPFTYLPDHLEPDIKTRNQFTIVIVEHIVSDTESLPRFLRFGEPSFSEHAAAFRLVTGITIGDRHKLYGVPQL
ncbi:hypothetical protein D3C83_109410 [compost metagenome]